MIFDPLYAFVFAGLFTPGPNVILLTASGARFGFRATLPHVLGVAAGVGVTSGLTALGMGALLLAMPGLTLVLKIIATGWILWMAFKLMTVAQAKRQAAEDEPWGFFRAVLFQWVNPKVWAIASAASIGYAAGLPPAQEAARLASAFSGINLGVCLFWSFAGSLLTYLLNSDRAWSLFNGTMALMLTVSAVMVFV